MGYWTRIDSGYTDTEVQEVADTVGVPFTWAKARCSHGHTLHETCPLCESGYSQDGHYYADLRSHPAIHPLTNEPLLAVTDDGDDACYIPERFQPHLTLYFLPDHLKTLHELTKQALRVAKHKGHDVSRTTCQDGPELRVCTCRRCGLTLTIVRPPVPDPNDPLDGFDDLPAVRTWGPILERPCTETGRGAPLMPF